jgi:hypothetical protein
LVRLAQLGSDPLVLGQEYVKLADSASFEAGPHPLVEGAGARKRIVDDLGDLEGLS